MAIQFGVGIIFGEQTALGTPNTTIQNLVAGGGSGGGGEITEADGAVLGDPESGQAESGIDFQVSRNLREKSVISGSFTRPPSDFLSEDIETFTVAITMKGGGTTLSGTPADSEFSLAPGVEALFKSFGLQVEDWQSGVGQRFFPASSQTPLTAKIFIGGPDETNTNTDRAIAWAVQDVVCTTLEITQPPGELGIATFTLAGNVLEFTGNQDFPAFDYGLQATTSAPTVENAGNIWSGASPVQSPRGFTACTITLDAESEDIPDSNAPGGSRTRQTGRTITTSMSLYATDDDPAFERNELVRESGNSPGPLNWTVGTPGAPGDLALAYRINVTSPEPTSLQFDTGGPDLVWNLDLIARSNASQDANSEFELIFL